MSANGLRFFGSLAERYSRSLSVEDPIVVFDAGGAAAALRECAERRFAGETFFVRPILQDESTVRTDAVAASIFATFATSDERRIALEQAFAGTLKVNGRNLMEVVVYQPEALRLMQGVVRLADGIAVSSQAERDRIRRMLQTDPPAAIFPMNDTSVPVPVTSSYSRDAIVIWAPHLSGDAAITFVTALADLRLPLLLASASAPAVSTHAIYVPPQELEAALSRAKLILDTSAHGCDAVRRLSAWGVPLVVDAASGGDEIAIGARVFDRRRFASIIDAVASGLGAPAPKIASEIPASLEVVQPLSDGPLVSVVIPTLDRPKLLALSLESIRRQTYKNIETIVVIDGGPRLDALAKDFPEVRFIHMPENNPLVSSNTAFAATSGKYVAFLNDDDVFFPNHIGALVTALERSQEAVANGDVLTAFLRGSDDEWLLYGFESNMSRAVELSSILVSNQIGMTSCMFRRDCIEDEAPFEEAVPLYRDYALWLKLAAKHDFVHVERITSCYTIRNQGAQQQSTMWYGGALKSYEVLYENYPANGRPAVEARREQVLASVKAGQMGIADAAPAGEVDPVPWPLW